MVRSIFAEFCATRGLLCVVSRVDIGDPLHWASTYVPGWPIYMRYKQTRAVSQQNHSRYVVVSNAVFYR